MLRSVISRHSMAYASPHPTGFTWVKSSPAAKQMLGKPILSLAMQPQQRHDPRRLHRHFARCMASSRGSDDKSWSELASEAAGVAASALGKLGKTISNTVTALVPQAKQSPPSRSPPGQRYGRSDNEHGRLYPWERDRGSTGLTQGLMGGLMGRAVGGMLGGMARQLQQQQQQAADLRQQALHAVQGDRRVQTQLGREISVGPGSSSQSTSSSWVNGQAITTTTLQFYVVGSSGRQALTSVRESTSGGKGTRVNVQVQLPTGEVIDIDGSDSSGGSSLGSEDIIDVEVRDVR